MQAELSRRKFDILASLAESGQMLTQRELEKLTPYSLGTINKTVKELTEEGLIAGGAITQEGRSALEPYRAKLSLFRMTFGTTMTVSSIISPRQSYNASRFLP